MTDISGALQSLPSAETLWAEASGHGLKSQGFKKNLAQNFIFDERLVAEIAHIANVPSATAVLEIGCGAGSLTRALLAQLSQAESQAKVFAIEPDARAIKCLEPVKAIAKDRLQIIEGFAEKQNFAELCPQGTAVVANLPYNVASVILLKLLENSDIFTNFTLMFQAEVAMRICASPNSKDYGRLSVAVQFLCEARQMMIVPAKDFTPPPKVDSAVVRLLPYGDRLQRQSSFASVQVIAKAAFSMRRKMLRKTLQSVGGTELLKLADIDGQRRAETLTIEEFDRLASIYEKHNYERQLA